MKPLEEYASYIKGKRAAVIGIGKSNLPLIDFLLSRGAIVTACDKKSRAALGGVADALEEKGVTLSLGEGYLSGLSADVIYKSPGIRYDVPEIAEAAARGAVLSSEMELFFRLCPATIIGITGSDGKTTTTTLIYKILLAEKERTGGDFNVFVGGNIGTPLLPLVENMKKEDFAVVELSSFQLHRMRKSPSVSVITNLSPNHLNWHTDMAEYVDAKKNIFRYQTVGDLTVLNAENELTRACVPEVPGKVRLFSSKNALPEGVSEQDGVICLDGMPILPIGDIRLPGRHNVENYMAAIGATAAFVSPEAVREVARTFTGVEHRIEPVREKDGVIYYNSSIDSSPTRTIAALNAFPLSTPLVVILGGQDKHVPFDSLAEPLMQRARLAVVYGEAAVQILSAVKAHPDFEKSTLSLVHCPKFDDAVAYAAGHARAGDAVILSPSCASFDAFANFEERGHRFKELVLAL